MSKYRNIFILASALIWGIALVAITKIKSENKYTTIEEPLVINSDPAEPPPPPPPPPQDDTHELHRPVRAHLALDMPNKTIIPKTFAGPKIETVNYTGPSLMQNYADVAQIPTTTNIISVEPPPQKKCKATGPIKISQYDISDAYPAEALEKEVEGSASIDISIDDSGHVSGASVVSASNTAFRSTSVAREAKSLKFKPAIGEDCNPISSSYTINVVFKL